MKIVSQDANQLVATDKALSGLILGIVFTLGGVIGVITSFVISQMVIAIIAGIFALVGTYLLITYKSRTFTIDLAAGQASLFVKKLTSSETIPLPLASVVKLQLVSEFNTTYTQNAPQSSGISFGNRGNSQTVQQTQLLVVTQDGTSVDISDGSRNMNSMNLISKVPNQEIGERIAAFMNVPFETQGPAAIQDTIKDVVSRITGQGSVTTGSVVQPPVPPADTTPTI